jgi:hypothetical protein
MLEATGNIHEIDLDLIPILDDPAEVVDYINSFFAERHDELTPNYTL